MLIALAIAEAGGKTPQALNVSMLVVAAVWLIVLRRYLSSTFTGKEIAENDDQTQVVQMVFCQRCNRETLSAEANCMWCGAGVSPNSKLNPDA
ncbi:hypothetical protein GCM10027343_02960 [Noviherbaspirillum agri]